MSDIGLLGISAFCSNCRFWESDQQSSGPVGKDVQGNCRAYPPVPKPWPKTKTSDWCGGWQQKCTVEVQTSGPTLAVQFGTPLAQIEDLVISHTLEACNGDKEKAAKVLGISVRTLYRRDTQRPISSSGD